MQALFRQLVDRVWTARSLVVFVGLHGIRQARSGYHKADSENVIRSRERTYRAFSIYFQNVIFHYLALLGIMPSVTR